LDRIDCLGSEAVVIQLADNQQQTRMIVWASWKLAFISDQVVNQQVVFYCNSKKIFAYVQVKM